MKVILKEYVYMHGVAGDIVEVADGFARNFLIPQGKAIRATSEALKHNTQLMEQAVIRRQELNSQLVSVAERINGVQLVFGRKAGRNNKLYGSVTSQEIAEALLEKTGIDINRRRISESSLRELGVFEVPIRMSATLSPTVIVIIVPEGEEAEALAFLEASDEETPEEGEVIYEYETVYADSDTEADDEAPE